MFTKVDAQNIADKLRAVIEEGSRRHTLALFYYNGKRILAFGIRRGSRKDQDHGHLPRQLHLTQQEARRLADCPLTLEGYVRIMREKGLIPAEEKDAPSPN